VVQTVLRNAQAFGLAFGDWVVKTNALDETAVAAIAFVGNHNVKKRTGF
jgi:hypothetical protein